jgi:hypothetical protein
MTIVKDRALEEERMLTCLSRCEFQAGLKTVLDRANAEFNSRCRSMA